MTRPDDRIRALAAEVRAAHAAAAVAIGKFGALQPGRKIRAATPWLTWADWLLSPDGVAYSAHCAAFEAVANRLIDARPETVAGYALKIETLELADLDEADRERLAVERWAIIAGEGGAA